MIDFDGLRAVISHFAARSTEKLRHQHLATQALTVFIQTSPFDTHHLQYANSATTVFELPTSDSAQLIHAAHQGLERVFKKGFSYQRAGIYYPIYCQLAYHKCRYLTPMSVQIDQPS